MLIIELEDHDWGSNDFPLEVTEIIKDQLQKLNVLKSRGPDGIHL